MLKVLFVATTFPIPPHAGGNVALLQTLQSIQDLCELHLLVPRPDSDAENKIAALNQRVRNITLHLYQATPTGPAGFQKYAKLALSTVSGRSYHSSLWMDKNLRQTVSTLQAAQNFDIVHCEWLYAAIALRGLNLPVVVRTLDLHSVIMRDGLEEISDRRILRKSLWRLEAERFRRFEISVLNDALFCITLSPEDEEVLRNEGVLRLVRLPPPMALPPLGGTPPKRDVCMALFLGVLHASVNRESSFLFTDEILSLVNPEVRKRLRIVFAGGRPDGEARRRAAECGIEIHAPLSDDEARQLYAEADIFISPIKTGTGIKTKTQEAMANGKPIIGFPNSFRGVPAVDQRDAFIVNSNAEFARRLETLVVDPELRERVGKSARAFVDTTFNPKILGRELITAYSQALNRASARRAVS
jgi:glycosyltransferase involved in cell wall biosynthesis